MSVKAQQQHQQQDDAFEIAWVMRRQEETLHYQCIDYLSYLTDDDDDDDDDSPPTSCSWRILSNKTSSNNLPSLYVDETCRNVMAKWCRTVVERCSFDCETVSLAMNILDRFLSRPEGMDILQCRTKFQLASMTCLYMAIKIHESEALQPQTIVQLSRGLFTVSQVEEMERKILFAIEWKVSPPTAWTFLHYYLDMAESWLSKMDSEYRVQILQIAKLQIQFTSLEYYYSTKKASSIAHAALTNALKTIGILSPKIDQWLVTLGRRLEIDYCEVCTLQKLLHRHVPLNMETLAISTVSVSTSEETQVRLDTKKSTQVETTTKGPTITNRELSSPRDVINCVSNS